MFGNPPIGAHLRRRPVSGLVAAGLVLCAWIAPVAASGPVAGPESVDLLQARIQELETELSRTRRDLARWKETELKLRIEAALAGSETGPIALFQLPRSQGGYLEEVRTQVVETIVKLEAAGEATLPAADFVARGDRAMKHGFYKEAYSAYARAYRTAVE